MGAPEMYPDAYNDHMTGDAAHDKAFVALADCPTFRQVTAALAAFEAKIRKDIAADIRAAAPKYLDSDVDVHVWHVLDDLSNEIEHPDKENDR